MASDVMGVRLHLRQIRVLAVVVDTPGELVVEVESTVTRPRCSACGFRCGSVHGTRRRKVRDLEVSGGNRRYASTSASSATLGSSPGSSGSGCYPALATSQCRNWRSPVKSMAMLRSSAAATTAASLSEPPGWTTTATPASAAAPTPSANG